MDYTVKSSYQNINYTTTVFTGYTALFVLAKVLSICGGGALSASATTRKTSQSAVTL